MPNRSKTFVRDHFSSLAPVVRGKRRILWRAVFFTVGVPLAGGAWALTSALRLRDLSALVAGVSILGGLLFALVIFVFQLRLSVSHDPRVQQKVKLPALIDELFSSVLYAVALSLLTAGAVIAAQLAEPVDEHGVALGSEPWVSALTIVLSLHLFFVIIEALRRTRTAYRALKG